MWNRQGWVLVVIASVFVMRGVPASALPPPDVSGSWVLVQVMPALINLPLLGRVELTTITALFVDIEQRGRELTLHRTYCFQEVRTAPALVTTTIPDRFVASLAPDCVQAWLEESTDGWRFIQPPGVEVRGAHLLDPEREPLPTDPLDPRLVDQDGDGHPGLTIHVAMAGLLGGEAYVVNRTCSSLEGWVLEDGSIAGTIHWSSEQNVVAACDPLFLASYAYILHPDPAKHFFLMRRIAESDPCRAIRESLTELLRLPHG